MKGFLASAATLVAAVMLFGAVAAGNITPANAAVVRPAAIVNVVSAASVQQSLVNVKKTTSALPAQSKAKIVLDSSNSLPGPKKPIRTLPARIQAWFLLTKWRHTEYRCLNAIIMNESSWNKYARNASSGAYGIPQALPPGKMAGWWGSNWESSSYVQLFWMIREYIPGRYGTPCQAWTFHREHGWY
jgi:hypothetical protein